MRARLRKDERNIVYDIEIDDDLDYQSKNMLSVWKKTVEAMHFVKEYATMDDLLEEWEILQEPSEQTKQVIAERLHRLSVVIAHDLQVEGISWDETQHVIEDHLNNHYVRCVLEGQE